MEHIAVTPAEDDEVIVAGSAPSAESVPAPAPEPAPEPVPVRRPERHAYRETTLEDLEPGKMPTAQLIVIVAAIVCIIGALVYYFVAMR